MKMISKWEKSTKNFNGVKAMEEWQWSYCQCGRSNCGKDKRGNRTGWIAYMMTAAMNAERMVTITE